MIVRQAILNITDPGLAKVLEYLDSAREEFEKVKQEQEHLNGSEMFQRASQAATEVAAIIAEAEKRPEIQKRERSRGEHPVYSGQHHAEFSQTETLSHGHGIKGSS